MNLSQSLLRSVCALAVMTTACALDATERAQSNDAGTLATDGSASSAPGSSQSRTRGEPAELLVSLIDGRVMSWKSDGTLIGTLEGASQGPAFGMAFDADSKLYVTHGYTADLSVGNAIETSCASIWSRATSSPSSTPEPDPTS